MTTSDDVKNGLDQLARLLDDPLLEPNPDRASWAEARAALDHVQMVLEQQVLARLAAGAVDPVAVDVIGLVAATLHAAGSVAAARALFERAVQLATSAPQRAGFAAALREPTSFTMLAHAHWLESRGRVAEANARRDSVARSSHEDALRAAALGPAPAPADGRPVESAPPLFRLNGCGVGVYGSRDERADGSSITTYCISLLWLPVFPLKAYRVIHDGDTVGFLSHEPLSRLARTFRVAVLGALALALAVSGVQSWRHSPGRRAEQAMVAARALEARDPAAASAAWDDVLEGFHGKVERGALAPAAEGVVRTAVAGVHQPFTPADLDAERRVVARYEALPDGLRQGGARKLLVGALIGWADQLGAEDPVRARVGLQLLDQVVRLDVDAGVVIDTRRVALRRRVASSLVADEPVGALRLYLENGGDGESLEASAALLAPVVASPSLLLDLDDVLEPWLGVAERDQRTAPLAARLRQQLTEARFWHNDPTRQERLEEPEEGKLRAVLGAAPSDQELTVALAQLLVARGDADGAVALLGGFGKPGTLIGSARVLLASLRRDAGDLAGADAALSGWLDWRLAPFQEAVQRFVAGERDARARLDGELQAGRHDSELRVRTIGMGDEQSQREVHEWFEEKLAEDVTLSRLRNAWLRHVDVVPASLLLGQVKLERARAAAGAERDRLLADAERAYLGIQSVAGGEPSYHIGLGQVYYRLGRVADGDQEFAAAREDADADTLLELARTYRDLGMDNHARTLAEQAADHADADESTRSSAVVLRSILASDEDEQEKWLRRADNEQARLDLLQLQADRLLREGKLAEADAKYAEVAAEWSKSSTTSGTSANNAAIALDQRFLCTGDVAHLDRALKLYEASVRLQPDDAIATHNLAMALIARARLRVLERWVQVRLLRPRAHQVERVLTLFARGPLGEQVRAALVRDPAYRRAVAMLHRWQALAPQTAGAYLTEFELLEAIDETAGLRALVERTTQLTGFHQGGDGSAPAAPAAAADDDHDDKAVAEQAAVIARQKQVVDAAAKAPARTQAVAWMLLSDAEIAAARVERPGEHMAEARAAAERARALAPDVSSAIWLGWIELADAFEAAADDDELRPVWAAARADAPAWFAAWTVATSAHGARYLAALRARPEAAAALARVASADPGVAEWTAAWLLGDAAHQQRAQRGFDREATRLRYQLRTHLFADDEALAREARFFAARGQVTSAANAGK